MTVSNPSPGGGISNPATLTVTANPRTIQALNASGGGGGTVIVPIQITAQGDENAIGFSLTFDQTLLSNPVVALGADAGLATLNTNASQVASGRYGMVLSLPTEQTFPAGTRHLANVTFTTAAVGSQTVTQIGFGDQPVVREVSDTSAETLLTGFTGGSVTLTLGYEADVAPRPNGSNTGSITISDWVQTGRFSSGLDTVIPGSEFQRADCAPRSSLGNGSITISDWVQAGRYASGLDPVLSAGGPTGTGSQSQGGGTEGKFTAEGKSVITDEALAPKSTVRLASTSLEGERTREISIELDTLGIENALGFSLMFDATKFSFVSARKGDAWEMATLNVNELEIEQGRVGIALALPAGTTFGLGRHQVVVLTFKAKADESETMLTGFSDQPVAREVVDMDANPMRNLFQQPDSGINPLEDAQFFVAQHYLDFLNRTADAGGLEYWTNQLRECGQDALCLSQRRVEVSAAFFMAPEFQQTGYTLYRIYKAAFGQRPSYQQFASDRGQLIAGPQLPASTQEFANQFVQRAEFRQLYPESLTANQFVDRLYASAGLSAAQAEKRKASTALANQQQSRAQVLLNLIEQRQFKEREYNPAFVLMQYFGYLRRDPDQGGYDFWLHALNSSKQANYHGMVCSFLTSREYQERFGALVPRSNQECGQ
jgi:hypothetical protein